MTSIHIRSDKTTDTQRRKPTEDNREMKSAYKLRRETSEETNLADTLTAVFWPPEL